MRAHPALPLMSLVFVIGCREVGPNYHPPQIAAPPAYSEDGRNGNWVPATPADASDRGAWWQVYGDDDLNRLEQQCATNNYDITAALHLYEEAHARVRVARSALFPQASVGIGATRNRISDYRPLHNLGQPQDYWDFLIPFNISWEPDLWGGIRRRVESTAATAQATAADLGNVRLSMEGLLAVTYFQLRGIDLQASLLRSTLGTYARALELTQDRRQGGLASDSDVEQAKAQLEETRAELVDLGVQRAEFEHAIAVLTGVSATNFRLVERPASGDPPPIPTGIPSDLLQRRPDIAAAERRLASANAVIGVAKSAYYPTVVLGVGAGLESDLISNLFNPASPTWLAGATVNEQVFDGGARRGQLLAARAERDRAEAVYREQVVSAFRDVEDQLAALRVLEDEASIAKTAVAAAKRSTELSTIRYKRGLAAYLEVLTNQTIELADERLAASLVSRRLAASASLQMALGGGWEVRQLPEN